jgi:hypothetical protein
MPYSFWLRETPLSRRTTAGVDAVAPHPLALTAAGVPLFACHANPPTVQVQYITVGRQQAVYSGGQNRDPRMHGVSRILA